MRSFFRSGGGGRVEDGGGGEERCGNYSIWQRLTGRPTSWKHDRRLVQLGAVPPWRARRNRGMQSSRRNRFGCEACDAMHRSKRKRGSERLLVQLAEVVSADEIRQNKMNDLIWPHVITQNFWTNHSELFRSNNQRDYPRSGQVRHGYDLVCVEGSLWVQQHNKETMKSVIQHGGEWGLKLLIIKIGGKMNLKWLQGLGWPLEFHHPAAAAESGIESSRHQPSSCRSFESPKKKMCRVLLSFTWFVINKIKPRN